jgi:hypothetical protein
LVEKPGGSCKPVAIHRLRDRAVYQAKSRKEEDEVEGGNIIEECSHNRWLCFLQKECSSKISHWHCDERLRSMRSKSPSQSPSPPRRDRVVSKDHAIALQGLARLSVDVFTEKKPFAGLVICVTGLSRGDYIKNARDVTV